jgi:flagellar hook assembly protein FlgD
LALSGPFSLKVYNTAGELVKTLKAENPSGAPVDLKVEWDGTNNKGEPVASGVYILHFMSMFESRTSKLLILR